MKNPIKFSYQIAQPGSARGEISRDGSEVAFDATNHANPLYDLLNGMSGMILNPAHLWGEENQAWIEWYGENGALRWVISTTDGESISIKLYRITDIFDDSGTEVVLEGTCKLNLFFYAVIKELDAMIKEMGLLNYSQKWQKDEFPLTNFLFLKTQLIDKGVWELSKPDNTTLSMEMELLLG